MKPEDKKLIDGYITEMETVRKLTITSIRDYRENAKIFIEFWKGNKSILKMDRQDFINFISHLSKRGNGPITIAIRLRFLSAFFGYLEDREIIKPSKNPYTAHKVKRLIPKSRKKKKDFLEPEEFQKYYTACYKTRMPDRNQLILLIMVSPGGTRSVELLGIKVEDIDKITGKTLLKNRMKPVLCKPRGATVIKKSRDYPVGPKIGKERYIHLTPIALDHVTRHIERNNLKPDDWIFKIAYRGLHNLFEKLQSIVKKDYNLNKKITPHRIRATSAVWCLRNRIPEKVIMKLFGWDTREMLDVYIELDDRDIEQEIERIFSQAQNTGLQAASSGGLGY